MEIGMILAEIKSRISSQTDYAPTNTPGWDQYLTQIINDAYTRLWYERPWTFNTKTYDLMVYPDLSAEQSLKILTGQSDTTTYPLVTQNTLTTFRITIPIGTPAFYSRALPSMVSQMIGASLCVEGRDYTIVDILFTTVDAGYTVTIYVDYPYSGDVNFSTSKSITDWTIKFKEYKLPSDVNEIMDVSWRNLRDAGGYRAGQSSALTERIVSDFNIDYQISAGKPTNYINRSYSFMYDTNDPITVTQNTGSGTAFPVGTYYFAWEKYDLVTGATSGITSASTVAITASNIVSLSFADYRALPVGQARRLLLGVKSGTNSVVKYVYMTNMYSNTINPWLEPSKPTIWRYGTTSKTLTIDDYDTLISSGSTPSDGYRGGPNMFQLNYNGNINRKNILFYPRLATVDFATETQTASGNMPADLILEHSSVATLRYLYKCAPLADEYDNPQLPAEYHNLLVFRALETISLKYGKLTEAAYYTRMSDDLLKGMLSRYGDERNTKCIKGSSMSIGDSWNPRLYKINFSA